MIKWSNNSYKSTLYWVIKWKLLFGEGNFSGMENEQFFASGQDSVSSYNVFPKQ